MSIYTEAYTVPLVAHKPEDLKLAPPGRSFTTQWAVVKNLTPWSLEVRGATGTPAKSRSIPGGMADKILYVNATVQTMQIHWLTTTEITTTTLASHTLLVDWGDTIADYEYMGAYPCSVTPDTIRAKITGPVTLTGPVKVEQQTGTEFVVTGTLDANITNATIDITPSTGSKIAVYNETNNVLQTGDAYKVLGTGAIGATTTQTYTITAPSSPTIPYGCLAVAIWDSSTTVYYCASVVIDSVHHGVAHSPFNNVAAFQKCATATVWIAYIPITTLGNGSAQIIKIYRSAKHAAAYKVIGLTSNPGAIMRADGRAYPLGVFAAQAQATTSGSHALIAAPTTPLRILLHRIVIASKATANAAANATIAGNGRSLIAVYGNQTMVSEPPGGILCDPATAVTLQLTAAKLAKLYAFYDLVV